MDRKRSTGIYFIPSFIVDRCETKPAPGTVTRAVAGKKLKVSVSNVPEAIPQKFRFFVFGPSDDLRLLFLSSSLIHTQLACLLLHSSSHPPLSASSSSSSPPLSSAHTHTCREQKAHTHWPPSFVGKSSSSEIVGYLRYRTINFVPGLMNNRHINEISTFCW